MILIKDRHPSSIPRTSGASSFLGNMILIKDRHSLDSRRFVRTIYWGNMILIKDRHTMFLMNSMVAITGKYDTYKESTLLFKY